MYSFGFNGYVDTIEGLQYNIENHNLSFCKYNKGTKKKSTRRAGRKKSSETVTEAPAKETKANDEEE